MQEDAAAKKPRPLRKRLVWGLVVVAVGLGVCLWEVSARKRLWAAEAEAITMRHLDSMGKFIQLEAIEQGGVFPETFPFAVAWGRCMHGIENLLADPWGNAYRYERPTGDDAKAFLVWSCGPDGVSGTADDIVLSVPFHPELQELPAE
jgi:hypothetical protein